MNDPSFAHDDDSDRHRRIRTVSEAREWLAGLAQNGASGVQIKEPFQPVGGGLVIVQASLLRDDGIRVNVAVYCYDDTPPPSVVDWLPPIVQDEGNAPGCCEDEEGYR